LLQDHAASSTSAIAYHRRQVQVIAKHQLARAYAEKRLAPADATWPLVIDKLTLWIDRLQHSEQR